MCMRVRAYLANHYKFNMYTYMHQRLSLVITWHVYRSEEASNEMEALARASHNPDEIVLGEDDEDEEQEIEGIAKCLATNLLGEKSVILF